MSIDVQKYSRLKDKAERAKAEKSRAEGALAEQLRRLKEEFDVETIEEAETLLKKLEGERDVSEKEYNEAMRKFEEEFGNV